MITLSDCTYEYNDGAAGDEEDNEEEEDEAEGGAPHDDVRGTFVTGTFLIWNYFNY